MKIVPTVPAPMLLELSCTRDSAEFWELLVKVLRIVIPHRTLVVWSYFSTMLFQTVPALHQEAWPQDAADAFALRPGALFQLIRAGFEIGVQAIPREIFADAAVFNHPLLRGSNVVEATTVSFGKPEEPSQSTTVLALYHAPEDQAELSRSKLIECFETLNRIVSIFLIDTQRNAFTDSAFGLLNDFPVGLIMLGWNNHQILFVNREGYRQTYVWNSAPDGRVGSDVKERFDLPHEINHAREQLMAAYIACLRQAMPPALNTITLTNARDPSLKVAVRIILDRDYPLKTPNFIVRFLTANARAVDRLFEPTSLQLSVLADLTATERSVAVLVMRGMTNKDIAKALNREVSTVKDHLSRIFDKLNIRSRTQLVRILTLS